MFDRQATDAVVGRNMANDRHEPPGDVRATIDPKVGKGVYAHVESAKSLFDLAGVEVRRSRARNSADSVRRLTALLIVC